MTHFLGLKKTRIQSIIYLIVKILPQINSTYFSKMVLQKIRNKTRVSVLIREFRCKQSLFFKVSRYP